MKSRQLNLQGRCKRRMGYAEKSSVIAMKERKARDRKQKATIVLAVSIFGGCVAWIYYTMWLFFNGMI